jgi:hypothetical protein
MAKKKDNTLLWVAALGVGGYLYYRYKQGQPLLPGTSTTANASTGVLALLPSPALSNAAPIVNAPVSNAPANAPMNTTGLVVASVNPLSGVPVLKPGQTLAVDNNGMPVVNSGGQPLVFPAANDSNYELFINNDYPGAKMTGIECL